MRTYPDCIPCFIRQSLEAARLVSSDESFHKKVLEEALAIAAELDYSKPPPIMGRDIHRIIRQLSGVIDPYHETKVRSNTYISGLLPELKKIVRDSTDPFETALRLAVAGNVIDFGLNINLSRNDIQSTISQALSAPFNLETVESLRRALKGSRSVLYIGDNAGEIVFDRLFIEIIQETLGPLEITFVVRGAPILNDATREDAVQAGIDKIAARVIDSGVDSPGTVLEDCSREFHAFLDSSDLVISKGQGNYETLSGIEQETYFLLKAKCAAIAVDTCSKQGELLLLRKPQRVREI